MKKKLIALGALFAICLSLLATDMVVKQKNGEDWKINVNDVEEVVFEETIPEDSTVIDVSETFLKFKILSDSTAEVTKESSNDCSYLGHDSITIPEKVRIDGKIYTVTSIGEYAFIYNFDLTYINIPESVTSIGKEAFNGCNSLEPELLFYDKGTKCYGWIGDKEKCIDVVIPEGVTSVGASAFYYCSNLTSVNIPEGVTSIGDYAFAYSSLTSINIPESVTSIGAGVFWDCSSLTSINIPESVTNIGASAFWDCNNLTSINIPESVISIGWSAFSSCSNLDIVINNSKDNVEVGTDAFKNCKSVTWLKD